MPVWFVVRKWLHSHLFSLSSRNLLIMLLAYIALSWLLLTMSGEQGLTEDISTFIYFLMVTASTVG